MQLRPTMTETLRAVRDELREGVTPEVTSATASMNLAMIDTILSALATRGDHEQEWMQGEIAEIRDVAAAIVRGGHDDGRIAEALAATDEDTVTDLQVRYHLASEVLSRCLEAPDARTREMAMPLLEDRLRRELEIAGIVSLAGRVGAEEPTTAGSRD